MGKRQKRFTGSKIFTPELLQKDVNVVMNNGVVHHLKIIMSTAETIFAEDGLKKRHVLAPKDIYEIILDYISAN